jgi:hypothetical protein
VLDKYVLKLPKACWVYFVDMMLIRDENKGVTIISIMLKVPATEGYF